MRLLFLIISGLIFNQCIGQSHIGLNLSGSSIKMYGGISYEFHTSNNTIIGAGLHGGQYGSYRGDGSEFDSYVNWLENNEETLFGTSQKQLNLRNDGFGLDVNLGKAFELDRLNYFDLIFTVTGYAVTETHKHLMGLAQFFPDDYDTTYTILGKTKHYSISNGLKFGYRRVMGPNLSLRIGAGMNFFFPIRNEDYNPQGVAAPMVALEYQLDLSMLYKFGKN